MSHLWNSACPLADSRHSHLTCALILTAGTSQIESRKLPAVGFGSRSFHVQCTAFSSIVHGESWIRLETHPGGVCGTRKYNGTDTNAHGGVEAQPLDRCFVVALPQSIRDAVLAAPRVREPNMEQRMRPVERSS
jgi:hypothetical protein